MGIILQKIKIENYRCFEHFEYEMGEFNTVVGKNAAGKTSLLHAINEISSIRLTKNTIYNNPKENSIQKITFSFSGMLENSTVKAQDLMLILTEKGIEIKYSHLLINPSKIKFISPKSGLKFIGKTSFMDEFVKKYINIKENKEFTLKYKEWEPASELKEKFDLILQNWDHPYLFLSINENTMGNGKDFDKILRGDQFRSLLHELILPQIVFYDEEKINKKIETRYTIQNWNDNFNFTENLLSLEKLTRDEFENLGSGERHNFIENVELKFNKILAKQPFPISAIQFAFQLIGDNFDIKARLDNGKVLEYQNLSSGLRWLFRFILVFFDPLILEDKKQKSTFNLILIDEPGKNLHPEAQLEVLNYLQVLKKNNQIIYTTHMPYLIDYTKPSNVQCIAYDPETQKHSISNGKSSELKVQIANAIGLPKEQFLSFPEKILLVEGPSDKLLVEKINQMLHDAGSDVALSAEITVAIYLGLPEINHLCKLYDGWDRRNFLLIYDDDTDMFAKKRPQDPMEEAEVQKFPKNIVKISHPSLDQNIAMEDFIPEELFKTALQDWLTSYQYEPDFIEKTYPEINSLHQSQIVSLLEKKEQLNKVKFIEQVLEIGDTSRFTNDKNIEFLFRFIKKKWQELN
ncbi:ATP-dependent endonuclease [Candidatus Lokiarchaeum ossiferum]|uniref:ATP-dependent endonuclease n=1 Tax=Candidatus Lokiarchaeum ossiferum TaxID=2951803 RepID=UPI00352BD50A